MTNNPGAASTGKAYFLAGGGEMGALMQAHDWSTSPIGYPDTWPQTLRTAVSMMLPSKHVMFVAWGPELAFLYNDAYRPVFGKKHPWALGRPFREVWPEVWNEITPLVDTALRGEATWSENLPLVLERNGYPEDCWFTFSYSRYATRAARSPVCSALLQRLPRECWRNGGWWLSASGSDGCSSKPLVSWESCAAPSMSSNM